MLGDRDEAQTRTTQPASGASLGALRLKEKVNRGATKRGSRRGWRRRRWLPSFCLQPLERALQRCCATMPRGGSSSAAQWGGGYSALPPPDHLGSPAGGWERLTAAGEARSGSCSSALGNPLPGTAAGPFPHLEQRRAAPPRTRARRQEWRLLQPLGGALPSHCPLRRWRRRLPPAGRGRTGRAAILAVVLSEGSGSSSSVSGGGGSYSNVSGGGGGGSATAWGAGLA